MTRNTNTGCHSALFRKNYAMLTAVFAAGFAFEVYGLPPKVTELSG